MSMEWAIVVAVLITGFKGEIMALGNKWRKKIKRWRGGR